VFLIDPKARKDKELEFHYLKNWDIATLGNGV
jgi:hypothetical protein